jgi:hypothetical protein
LGGGSNEHGIETLGSVKCGEVIRHGSAA